MQKVRTRFAPSPTGYLHIGSLRTALYSYLYARKHKGDFILRIEDTDQSRKVEGAVEHLIKTLRKVVMDYDEGPVLQDDGTIIEKGEFGPYYQSERLKRYRAYADKLIEDGSAFISFRTGEELDAIKLTLNNRPLRRKDLNENYTAEEVNTFIVQGKPYVIRLEMPEKGICAFNDIVRGHVEIDYSIMDDFVIMKSDGFATYNFANVIDDYEMEITHVLRGEEFISSMPKHIYLYQVLGFELPFFAHLPLLLNKDKSKLSKRQGDVAVDDYLQKGYLPQTLTNFVALLGWHPGDGNTEEFFSLKELIKVFELTHINKAGAVFDLEKLDWMNGKYLREKISIEEFLVLIENDLSKYLNEHELGNELLADKNRLNFYAQLIRQHITRLDQVPQYFFDNDWLDAPIEYEGERLVWKKSDKDETIKLLNDLSGFLSKLSDGEFDKDALELSVKTWINENNMQTGSVLWPMRFALSGLEKSPSPFELAYILGKKETLHRLKLALEKLS